MKRAGIASNTPVEVEAAQLRTPEVMKHDMRRRAPLFPSSDGAEERRAAITPHAHPAERKRVIHFLPTMPQAEYAERKTKAQADRDSDAKLREARRATGAKGGTALAERPARAEPPPRTEQPAPEAWRAFKEQLAPITSTGLDFEGATDVDGEIPPDTHGAVGLFEYVETTNSHIDIFDKTDPTNRTSLSLAAFFGYFTQGLFDARVIYDSIWNRWVVTADAFPESPTVQRFFIAVSTTESALGPFFVYNVNVDVFGNNDFWDYPQLGMDQDSVIFTANIFPAAGGFSGADMFAVAKARLYNGLGFSVPLFTGLEATLAPPIVLDQNSNTFLIAAPGGNTLKLYTLRNASTAGVTLSGPVDVAVDPYDVPPPAPQPGTNATLDTLDGRFVNASTQVGDFLWQVHTIRLGSFAAPKYYQINTTANNVVQSAFFFASATSFDFNASIATNADNDVFLNWSSTDPPNDVNAQVRFSGCDHNDGACFPGAGTAVVTSPTFFTGGRWGDYSAVTVDPSNSRQAWLVNEEIEPNADWGSHIARIGF